MKHSIYRKKLSKQVSLLLLFIILVCFCQNTASAEKYLTDIKINLISKIQTNIYLDNYPKAHLYADSLLDNDSNDPLGFLFKAAVYLGDMTNAEENLYPIAFNQMIDSTITLGEINILVLDSNSIAWNYLSIGHAHAYRSLYESRFGSLTNALKHGFNAKSAYQNGLCYDSTVYDLYGGLGMYHYWKTVKAGILKWVGIFKDDKQKGIDELYLAIDSSKVSADVAWSSLIWIYLDAEQYDTATVIAQRMYQKYPEGTTFLWALGKIYFQSEQYLKSIEVFQMINDKLMITRASYFNIIESEFYIYQAYKNLEDKEKAKEIATRFLNYVNKIPLEIRKKQRDKIEKLVNATSD